MKTVISFSTFQIFQKEDIKRELYDIQAENIQRFKLFIHACITNDANLFTKLVLRLDVRIDVQFSIL